MELKIFILSEVTQTQRDNPMNYRDGNGEEPEEEGPTTDPKWDPAQEVIPNPDTIIETMECSQKKVLSMITPKKTQQAATRVRCKYLQLTNGQKQLTSVVGLGNTERR